jgi:peptide deformylase
MGLLKGKKGKWGVYERKIVEKTEALSHIEGTLVIEHKISDSKKAVIRCKEVVTDAYDQNKDTRMKATKPCAVAIENTQDGTVENVDPKKVGELLFHQSADTS